MGQFGSDGYLYDFTKETIRRYWNTKTDLSCLQRSPEKYMGGMGGDTYLYDFLKRGGKDYMGQFGSDSYLYDFAKRNEK